MIGYIFLKAGAKWTYDIHLICYRDEYFNSSVTAERALYWIYKGYDISKADCNYTLGIL